jgi:hypothetical protein
MRLAPHEREERTVRERRWGRASHKHFRDAETGALSFSVATQSRSVVRCQCRLHAPCALVETTEQRFLGGAAGDQLHRVNAAGLSETIDPSDALLEPHRCPWQLEVHHEATPVVQVKAFTGRISREQNAAACRRELPQHFDAFTRTQSTVKLEWSELRKIRGEMQKGVAVLGEDEDGFVGAPNQSPQCCQFAFRLRSAARPIEELLQRPHLFVVIA